MRGTGCCVLWLILAAAPTAPAAAPPAADAARPEAEAGLALRSSRIESAAQTGGRFALRARLAPQAHGGELREGGDFVLLGRLSKAAVDCDGDSLFRDGFEGN